MIVGILLAGLLLIGLSGCRREPAPPVTPAIDNPAPQPLSRRSALDIVQPPAAIAPLNALAMDAYAPEVSILSPKPDDVLTDTTVSVRLRVKNLPIYIDNTWQLGPHLQVRLDNQESYTVYDTDTPLELTDLAPGTHTLGVIAAKPWHESFKNIDAYAQTTFHIFAETGEHQPTAGQPALIYSQPEGTYGAEPILVDFHLSDVPLHLIAQESDLDNIKDWHLRCTVNGDSIRIDTWEPVYLTGFKPGQNWVQLVLEDEDDQPIANAFNNTVRLIDYQPGGTDTLSQLMRGKLTAPELRGIVDPNYVPPAPEPASQGAAAQPPDADGELSEPAPLPLDSDPGKPDDAEQSLDEGESDKPEERAPADVAPESVKSTESLEPSDVMESTDSMEPTDSMDNKIEPTAAVEPGEVEPIEMEPIEAEPVEMEPIAAEPVEMEPIAAEPAEIELLEAEPAEAEPAEMEPGGPIEAEPTEAEPAEAKPAEAKPAETEPTEAMEVTEEVVPPINSGRRLLKRLYDYRDRAVESGGNR
ncbi:MAG: hypothetical protein AAFZ80_01360 [Cyanobacteria bacterium P01_A01_bin.105]